VAVSFIVEPVDVWAPQVFELLEALGPAGFVAGGAARQIVMRDEAPPAEDVDVFTASRQELTACSEAIRSLGYLVTADTRFATTYRARDWVYELNVQLIKPFSDTWNLTYGTPEEVLSRFSFTTEMFAIAHGEAIVGVAARQDTEERCLVLQNITDPLWVSLRATKYAAKGYSIAPSEMRRILDAWMDRPQQRGGHRGK